MSNNSSFSSIVKYAINLRKLSFSSGDNISEYKILCLTHGSIIILFFHIFIKINNKYEKIIKKL